MKPSTIEYSRYRRNILRNHERKEVLSVGYELMKENRKQGKRYSRKVERTLRGSA